MFSVDNIGSCNLDLKPYDLKFKRVTDKNRKGENEARFLDFIFSIGIYFSKFCRENKNE